jgi:hypothetical protein
MNESNADFVSISDWWNKSTAPSATSLQEALLEMQPQHPSVGIAQQFNPAYAVIAA